ncbi:hypothetical protein CKO51_02785 [Rhodopirellula sp. SM50]|nr:hypothetical protein [Rhodopirellula sp. SM50]PAY20992.1 hypothetical protein CKO51_02785 [Rhodopirellula sp. SM50]
MRDFGGTEVGGFGISNEHDLLLIEDIVMIDQVCTPVSVEFDDASVADFFDDQVDAGRSPEQFARVWIHTHPGSCPSPSGTDEETFQRCFGSADWAVMFILAKHGATYGRLRFNTGPGANTRLRRMIDYSMPFEAADHDLWEAEYARRVTVLDPFAMRHDMFPVSNQRDSDLRSDSPAPGSSWEDNPWEASEWVAS